MFPSPLKDKVVLVTGVGPGLGRSIALRSARAGADVVLVSRSPARLDAVAEEVAALGSRALVVPTDITEPADLDGLVHRALEHFGRVDTLVSNAFVPVPQEPAVEQDLEVTRAGFEVNVFAAIELTRRLVPTLRESQGSIVLINSMVTRMSRPGFSAYRMMKSSLLSLSEDLSRELGPSGIRVNSVAPGYIYADAVKGHFAKLAAARGVDPAHIHDEIAASTDLRRLPLPDEIADAVVFLASDMARAISGQCVDVNCGDLHH